MAITITAAAWVSRLAKLPGVKNTLDIEPKTIQRTTSPRTAGSEPMSPALTRAQ